ncbi:recombinase family protein [Streptomyces rubellomurinus]|uniref:recombinase family protein n=1 Tax=Streptomyces rubellomurinus (strain ATCC 31215) TaxID=359131 RepID=UPI002446757A|nr:recombinase family protein [Streptomyces rubellomurinus]
MRKTDRWAGGQPPYGYRIVDRPGGGRTLEPDPVASEAVRYMGKLLLEGQSQWMIAMALEVAGFDTPSMHAYKHQGESYSSKRKTPPSNHWNPTSVGKILRSPATMGLKLTGRSVKARKIDCWPGCGNAVRTDTHGQTLRDRADEIDQLATSSPEPISRRLRTNAQRLRDIADHHDATSQPAEALP